MGRPFRTIPVLQNVEAAHNIELAVLYHSLNQIICFPVSTMNSAESPELSDFIV